MINEEFVYCNVDFSTSEEMLTTVSKDLFIAGFVTDMYGKKIIEREKKYPTGLKLDGLNIAICHTDPEYVLKIPYSLSDQSTQLNLKTLKHSKILMWIWSLD